MENKSLQLRQLGRKMLALGHSGAGSIPGVGWIKALRLALGMSARQLGNKLSITRQGVQEMESREQDGSITIKSLRTAAKAFDMQLVYGFVPNDGSLDALIDRKAKELAIQIVLRTSQSMRLEDQENTKQRIEQAIEERAEILRRELPKALWD